MNVGFVSLGCSKNLVDTEMMVGLFEKNGYNIVTDPKEADIIIVNTCGFIESAKEEVVIKEDTNFFQNVINTIKNLFE